MELTIENLGDDKRLVRVEATQGAGSVVLGAGTGKNFHVWVSMTRGQALALARGLEAAVEVASEWPEGIQPVY